MVLIQFVLLLLTQFVCNVNGEFTVTSLPAALFAGGSRTVVVGSVVWLYCEASSTSPNLTVTWNRDNTSLVQDVPHIRMRSSTSGTFTSFLLVVENFQVSDSGSYQCAVQEGSTNTVMGDTLTLTASTAVAGSLQFISISYTSSGDGFLHRGRIQYMAGETGSITYQIGHVGDSSASYPNPQVQWLKDGVPASHTPVNIPRSNGHLISSLSFTFAATDAGVYQCVFTDTTRSEILVTTPTRLDTGETLTLVAISPATIILSPPEKLVLEVSTAGQYNFIQWSRDGNLPGTFFPVNGVENYAHFTEIYVKNPTTMDDLAVYGVELVTLGQPPVQVAFIVIAPVGASTTGGAGLVTVREGGNVDISCTSIGIPLPTISWTLHNQDTPFEQVNIVTTPVSAFYMEDSFAMNVTSGHVESTLQIVSAQYPAHDGEYQCTGANSHAGQTFSQFVTITVQVLVCPEVLVSVDLSLVIEGETTTLTCSVTRGNPMSYTYNWTHVDTLRTLNETADTLTLADFSMSNVGTYRCDVVNDAGIGSNMVTVQLGVLSIPNDVLVTNITSRTVFLTWSPPTGVVQSYHINLTDSSGVDSPRLIRITGGNISSYSVDALTPFTEYSLTLHAVSTTAGEANDTLTTFHTLEDIPTAVRNLVVTDNMSNILVMWAEPPEPNGNLIYVTSVVCVRLYNSVIFFASNETTSELTLTAPREPHSECTATVIPQTGAGMGPSSTQAIRTAEEVPSPASNITVTIASDASGIIVEWEEPTFPNGELQYNITLEQRDLARLGTVLADLEATTMERSHLFELSSTPYTLYTATVVAITAAGGGEPVMGCLQTEERIPSDIPMLSISYNATHIIATWSEPLFPNGDLSYNVSLTSTSLLDGSTTVIASGESVRETGYVVRVVVGFDTEYRATVMPYTGAGPGNSTVDSILTASLERPDPLRNITAVDVGPLSVKLRWTLTFASNKPVVNFMLSSRNINTSSNSLLANISVSEAIRMGGSFMYRVSGDEVQPFTLYTFTIVACNVIGCGDESMESPVVQTLQYTSSPPRNVMVSAVTSDTLTLQWLPPMTPNGIISAYMITLAGSKDYDSSFSPDPVVVSHDVSDLQVDGGVFMGVVEELAPGTMYTVTVRAINGAGVNGGVGEESEPVTALTTSEVLFQLRIIISTSCTEWINHNPVEKRSEITQEIINELTQRCQCTVGDDQISRAGFSCFEQSPNAVTFRARLTGSQQVSAQQLVSFLEEWVASGAFLLVQAQLLRADESCAVLISSLDEAECQPMVMTAGDNLSSISAALGVLLVLTASVVISVVVIILLIRRRKKMAKMDQQVAVVTSPAAPGHDLAEVQELQSETPDKDQAPHIYECIKDDVVYRNPEARPGLVGDQGVQPSGMELTRCVAYGTDITDFK